MLKVLKLLSVAAIAFSSLAAAGQSGHHSSLQSTKSNPPSVSASVDPNVNVAAAATGALRLQAMRDAFAVKEYVTGVQLGAFYTEMGKQKAAKDYAAAQARQQQQTVTPHTQAAAQPTSSHPQATVGGRIPYNYSMWMRVHNCEQPETWHAGGHFGNGLPSGGNGLGFSLYAWRDGVRYAARRGVILPASGWDATPDQQMQVAQAMLDATGGGPDCL